MHYRRNADDRLRQAERAYEADPRESTLLTYNVERVRAGLHKLIATEKRMLDSLMEMVDVRFKPVDVRHAQFSVRSESNPPNQGDVKCWEIAARTLDLPVRPTNESIKWVKEQYQQMIPVITGLGWVVLYRQCAYGETTLRMEQLPNNEGWVVYTNEDEEIIRAVFRTRTDAIEHLLAVQGDIDVHRAYPALYVFQPYVFSTEYCVLSRKPIISIEREAGPNINTRPFDQVGDIITVQTGFKQPTIDHELDADHPSNNVTIMYALVKNEHPTNPVYSTYECLYYYHEPRSHLILSTINAKINRFPDLTAAKADLLQRILREHPASYPYNRCKLQLFE